MTTSLIRIENRAGKVTLDDTVNPESTKRLLSDMEKLYGQKAVIENMRVGEFYANAEEALDTLEIEIHSPGGSVFDGWRMHEAILAMRERGVKVVATINSLAASMATVVAIAADEVRIVKSGRMMIHDASTLAMGTADELRKQADLCESLSDQIAQAYADKTGKKKEEMRALMLAETWLTAPQAVDLGLADSIIQTPKTVDTEDKAMALTDVFKNLFGSEKDADLQAKFDAALADVSALEAAVSDLQSTVEQLTAELDGAKAEVVDLTAKLDGAKAENAALNERAETAEKRIPDLEEQARVTPEKIAAEATNLLASQGHTVVSVSADETATPTLLETLAQLSGNERTTFYRENEKAIKAELRNLKK